MNVRELYHNKWVRLVFWSLLYLLWVIWLGNYWFLLGLVVIFDHHITRKVKWLFWKKYYKEGEKRNAFLDWLDAIIFAVVFVTFINIFFFQAFKIPSSSMESSLLTGDHLFVSKLTFGPRIPETPLTIPFTHNVFFGKESYSTLIHNEYRRLKGFRNVRRGDYVVFGFPNGDTVLAKAPADDYYTLSRFYGRDYTLKSYGPVIVRPSDKKDHYVKRCVAIAGDTLSVRDGRVYIGSQAQEQYPGLQSTYDVKTDGSEINRTILEGLDLNWSDYNAFDPALPGYVSMPLTKDKLEKVRACSNVVSVEENIDVYPPDYPDSYLMLFPYKESFHWTRDNYGPIWVPKQGVTVKLTPDNFALYERIIAVYEHNDICQGSDGGIYINGERSDEYTFKQDYYFMMGDNRHNSLDSRYWGFAPEDHIVGRPALIWLSIDKNKNFPLNIRWKRFFKPV